MEFTINGDRIDCDAAPDEPLLWMLRDRLHLKGTKYGCGVGACGICAVLLDGEVHEACMVSARDAAGREITTIEGLSGPDPHPLLPAWVEERVAECGYCQPGMIIAAAGLLARDPAPDDAAIDRAMSGVVCRCGTYGRIRRAIHRAASGAAPSSPARFHGNAREARTLEELQGVPLNPWIKINGDGSVTVVFDRCEMGQDALTGLALLVAEELRIPLDDIGIEFAPVDAVYDNPAFGEQQTSGSTSIKTSWNYLRRAGAKARRQLVGAAAAAWQVDENACVARDGRVEHPESARSMGYGELAEAAAGVDVSDDDIELQRPEDWKLIGRRVPALDGRAKSDGSARYGMDVELPAMVYATVLHSPAYGGTARDIDTRAIDDMPGLIDMFTLREGSVVIAAKDSWSAFKASGAIRIDWEPGGLSGLSDEGIRERLSQEARRAGKVAKDRGDVSAALDGAGAASLIVESEYATPYLAHATMEPMNCTVRLGDGTCDVWVPTQVPTRSRDAAARTAGIAAENVRVHATYAGGGFGRRLKTDFVEEAVEAARHLNAPVQLFWRREEDMRRDFYRPAHHARLRAALDSDGRPLAWEQTTAGPGLSLQDVENAYAIPNLHEEVVECDPGIPTGAWRSVGASQNAFVIESFIDELAHAAGEDPLTYRRALLEDSPRHRGVLDLVAEKSDWYGSPPAEGRGRGVAVYYHRGSWVAEVAEVSVGDRGPHVERIVCAVDCGIAVDPAGVVSQIQGGAMFGLSAALWGRVTIERGAARESSFKDYRVLSMAETPDIDVHIADSTAAPGGVGECAVPPVAPAVANAWFAATGQRVRELPLAAL